MKSFIHKISALLMATLVLFTTMSFTVDMHYCGERLVDFSLSQNVNTCGMQEELPSRDCESGNAEDSCCSDKQMVVEGQDEIKASFDTLNFGQHFFIATFLYTYTNLFEDLDSHIIPFRDYRPPILTRDIQKLHETYLI